MKSPIYDGTSLNEFFAEVLDVFVIVAVLTQEDRPPIRVGLAEEDELTPLEVLSELSRLVVRTEGAPVLDALFDLVTADSHAVVVFVGRTPLLGVDLKPRQLLLVQELDDVGRVLVAGANMRARRPSIMLSGVGRGGSAGGGVVGVVSLDGKRALPFGSLRLLDLMNSRKLELVHDGLRNLPLVVVVFRDHVGLVLVNLDVVALEHPLQHVELGRPEQVVHVFRVDVEKRPLGVAGQIDGVVGGVVPRQRPGIVAVVAIQDVHRRLEAVLVHVREDGLGVRAELVALIQHVMGLIVEGAIVGPHDTREHERVGILVGDLALGGVTVVADVALGRLLHHLGVLVHAEEHGRRADRLADFQAIVQPTRYRRHASRVRAANHVHGQQVFKNLLAVGAGEVPSDAYETAHISYRAVPAAAIWGGHTPLK